MTKQEQIEVLTDKISQLKMTKESYLLQKGKQVKGISIRTNTESVTFNTLVENPIYEKVVSDFIDSLVPKIEEEITMLNDYIEKLSNSEN
jgi:hypothetical protein